MLAFLMSGTRSLAAFALLALPALSALPAMAADIETRPAQNAANADYASGKRAVDNKDWPAAAAAFRKVLMQEPRNADAYTMLGYALRWQGRLDEAFAAYDRALQIDPAHRGAHQYLGIAYLKAGKRMQAEQQLATLERLAGRNADEYRTLADALAQAQK